MQIQCRCSRTGSGKLFIVRIFSGTNSNTSNWEDSKLVKLSDLRRKQSQRLYLILNIGYHAVDGSLKRKKSEGDSASYKPASLLADQSLSWLHTFQGRAGLLVPPHLSLTPSPEKVKGKCGKLCLNLANLTSKNPTALHAEIWKDCCSVTWWCTFRGGLAPCSYYLTSA